MKFKLKDIEVEVFLGITGQERKNKQKILVTLLFKADEKPSIISDNIDDTLDYFEIYQFIKGFPKEKSFNLLEYLHHEMLEAISQKFPEAEDLELKIKKFPFPDGFVEVS
ncbi:dihydroneopterin aldolase [Candidatus Gracilibacteria bacterium]|nr:dihydroneopterin aldolase [Candidatus Gracilibacteria bacterium]